MKLSWGYNPLKQGSKLAGSFGKTAESMRVKIKRLGLEVEVGCEKKTCRPTSSTPLELPEELPTVETVLKKLVATGKPVDVMLRQWVKPMQLSV